MAAKDPNAVGTKWSNNLANSTQSITDGVNGVTKAPGMAAVAQSAVWLANTQASVDKWKRNTGKVTVDEWKQSMITKGIPRIAAGANAAQPKMVAFLTDFLPFVDRVVQSLPPRGGLDQNINRMVANARALSQYKRP